MAIVIAAGVTVQFSRWQTAEVGNETTQREGNRQRQQNHTAGEVLVGDAAERRAVTEPLRVVREFKRRFGDPVGTLVGSQMWGAETLMARLLAGVAADAAEREGTEADLVVLTYPANWGPYKVELRADTARLARLKRVVFVVEPVAAALHHSQHTRADRPARFVVYDLGGGTFDATLVTMSPGGEPAILGVPGGWERLGGIDFDEALRT